MGFGYRLLASLGVLVVSTVGAFAVLASAPGGVIAAYAGRPALGAIGIDVLNHEFGAGRPLYAQYFIWLHRVLEGDLGWSRSNAQPVAQALAERLPATIELAVIAFAVSIVLGAIVGFACARARVTSLRTTFSVLQLVCRAIPVAILALYVTLLFVFVVRLPVAGASPDRASGPLDWIPYFVGPVVSLAVPFGAWASLIFYGFFRTRNERTPVSPRAVFAPIAITAARIGPALLSASILVIEPRFAWPGLARPLLTAFTLHDFGIVAGFVLVYSTAIVLLGLCGAFSPRTAASNNGMHRGPTRSATGRVALVLLLGIVVAAAIANLLPWGPYYIDQVSWNGYPRPPGVAGHLLGTDDNGRDLLSRLFFGLRTSLGIAAIATVAAAAVGALAARLANVLHWPDGGDVPSLAGVRPFAGLPFIVIAVDVLLPGGFHGVRLLSPLVIGLMIAAVSWPAIVPAFRTLGRATIGSAVGLLGGALLLEVTVSSFGIGVQPPAPSLGNMLLGEMTDVIVAPWNPVATALVVIVVLFALYALGDAIAEPPTAGESR